MDEKTLKEFQKDCDIPHLPTALTYELRQAVFGVGRDEFLSWGYQWADKPHRLVFTACRRIEYLEDILRQIVERSHNDPLGTSKVLDMRKLAEEGLKP